MKIPSVRIMQASLAPDRLKADSLFTRVLVRALKLPHSFRYPFDSLRTVSLQYAPDSSFRIFTWQLYLDDDLIRQHGAIQVKTRDGSLSLFPLFDRSEEIEAPEDTITDARRWIGAVYYRILQHRSADKDIYTLLGFDENGRSTNRKIIDILTFEEGKPVFGGPYFRIPTGQLKPKQPMRYIMEYKKHAGPRLTYDDDLRMIILEHLVSESGNPKQKWTLVGDGDYDGMRWQNGMWIYVTKIFDTQTPEGQTPVPQPIRDDKGNFTDPRLKGKP